jgi:hypothetical protein
MEEDTNVLLAKQQALKKKKKKRNCDEIEEEKMERIRRATSQAVFLKICSRDYLSQARTVSLEFHENLPSYYCLINGESSKTTNVEMKKQTVNKYAAMDEIEFEIKDDDDLEDNGCLIRFTVVCGENNDGELFDATIDVRKLLLTKEYEKALRLVKKREMNDVMELESDVKVELSIVFDTFTLFACEYVNAEKVGGQHTPGARNSISPSEISEKSVSWHDEEEEKIDDDDDDDDARGDAQMDGSLFLSENNRNKNAIKSKKLVSCLRELIPKVNISSYSAFKDSKKYAHDTTALIRAQYAELVNIVSATTTTAMTPPTKTENNELAVADPSTTNRTLIDHQSPITTKHDKELSWFSAGVRAGVGVGLGACLGVGIGFGIIVNSVLGTNDRVRRLGTMAKAKLLGGGNT